MTPGISHLPEKQKDLCSERGTQVLFCVYSDHLQGPLFPQPEHIAAARAEHPLHGGMVALQQRFRHIGLNSARKAAALNPIDALHYD